MWDLNPLIQGLVPNCYRFQWDGVDLNHRLARFKRLFPVPQSDVPYTEKLSSFTGVPIRDLELPSLTLLFVLL